METLQAMLERDDGKTERNTVTRATEGNLLTLSASNGYVSSSHYFCKGKLIGELFHTDYDAGGCAGQVPPICPP